MKMNPVVHFEMPYEDGRQRLSPYWYGARNYAGACRGSQGKIGGI